MAASPAETADPLGVRTAAARVVEAAADVRLGPLETALESMGERPIPPWDSRRHYGGERSRLAVYILVLDTVNFCFWGMPGGYWRLAEGLRDAFRAGDDLARPDLLARIEPADLARWTGPLPLLEERAEALRELGELALRELSGDLTRLVEATAAGTASGLAARLSSFRDVATYQDQLVPFLKRAQIAAADLAAAGGSTFPDLGDLTCFADYKLPQALRHLGALEYSDRLARRVDDWRELEPGEPAEVEIRAATVISVERLVAALAGRGRRLRAFEVDWLLWSLAQELYPVRPHHRVRTVFY